VVVRGTDTRSDTIAAAPAPDVPIVLTGAAVPFVAEGSDRHQNATEALFGCRLPAPGVYAVFHGRALAVPSVVTDRDALTFIRNLGGSISESKS
jgi:L-asparaginase/Glu-tRNA(Gln) amidotransferase subunit D